LGRGEGNRVCCLGVKWLADDALR